MNISFDTENRVPNVSFSDHSHTDRINKPGQDRLMENAGSLAVSMGFNNDLAIIPGDAKDSGDLAANLSQTDVELKKDYMSVMSLSMSDKDYAEFAKTGRMPEDMDASDAVTILDDIKAALIKGGTEVAGFTDTIDSETLTQITGSQTYSQSLIKKVTDAGLDVETLEGIMDKQDVPVTPDSMSRIADAVSLAKEALPLSDETAAYFTGTGKSPVIMNIYQAAGAGASLNRTAGKYYAEDGYVSRMSDAADIDSLRDDIEDTIKSSGLEVNEETLADAKSLIRSDIPLTPETLLELDSIKELKNEPDPVKIANSAAIAMSAGIDPKRANLTYDESIYIQAEKIKAEVDSFTEEAADEVASRGMILNIRNLRMASAKFVAASGSTAATDNVLRENGLQEQAGADKDIIHARRILEEVRLTMSVSANRLLLKNNYRIDTAPMEELVDALKKAEEAAAGRLFASDDGKTALSKNELYKETENTLSDIMSAPASILGQYRSVNILRFGENEVFTLNDVFEAGQTARTDYLRAGESYEALMTAPRADMGDSIKKAFKNVDDILNDLQIEADELSRRAVRILGYNSIEITEASIMQVKAADINLRSVLARLTPDRVLTMIREDENPLNMTMSDLSDYLDRQDSEPERKAADYAKFLMQLERRGEITELERDSYIGIYRMISKLDRTDDAALGKLLSMGTEISFSTLLSAMRSSAKSGMDYRIDDDFAGVDAKRASVSIDAQINAAFSAESSVRSNPISETVIENLLMSGNEVSFTNMEALDLLKNRRADYLKFFEKRSSGIGSEDKYGKTLTDILKLSDEVLDNMTDPESYDESYSSMLDEAQRRLEESMYDTADVMDIRAIKTSMKQIGLLKGYSQDNVYDLPTLFDGELTSIRLVMRHDAGAGRVAVTLSAVTVGNIAAEFSYANGMSGYVACENSQARDRLSEKMESLAEVVGFTPEIILTDRVDPAKYTDRFGTDEKNRKDLKENDPSSDINNIELYRVAESFIRMIRSI